jgi:hypothetical protein
MHAPQRVVTLKGTFMRTFSNFFWVFVLLSISTCAQPPEPTVVDVPMQDGTLLKTTVALPAGEGPFPTIVWRSTYGRNIDWVKEAVGKGYAAVIQDVRGMGESPGDKYVFHADGWQPGLQDGHDTMEWVAAQPWCNGKIGTSGGSALGITQLLSAPTTDKITCQVVQVAGGKFWGDMLFIGGVWRKHMLEGWLTGIGQPHLIDVYKSHPNDGEFWSYYDSIATAPKVTAPAIFHNGWYDIFCQGTVDSYMARENNGGPGAKGNNYLIMTWGSHGPDIEQDYKYNPNRHDLKIGELFSKFYDFHLKGNADAMAGVPKVHYYVMGADTPGAPGNEWRTADAWPPYPTQETALNLWPDGSLRQEEPIEPSGLSFIYDPANPYPTLGGANLIPDFPAGIFDQRKFSTTRTDLLKFATPPLTEPLEITGNVKVRLAVSSDAPDTDFTAKLVDIFPDGDSREINLLDNIRRVKTRNGYSEFAPLLTGPEEVVVLEIDLWSIAWVFNTGHRIGLHISSSNYPRFELNPNTGANYPVDGEPMRPAVNTVRMGPGVPSSLILPVRPAVAN